MQEQAENLVQQIFVPAPPIQRITSKQTMGKVQVAPLKQPDTICGIARRVGYTGKGNEDLATYRLKIKTERSKMFVTLPSVFVVENGVFLDYEAWHSDHHEEV
jgi:hypothetical protein